MASTITNLINTIDTTFPIAGQNNDSQGFRSNFSIIQSALLNTEAEIESIQATLSTPGPTNNVDAYYVTGTHVIATTDFNIGGTNIITAGSNLNTIITAGGGSGNVLMSVNTVSSIALDFVATNTTTATSIYLFSTNNILTGSTFFVGLNSYTATNVDYTTNLIDVYPGVSISDLSTVIANQTPIIFNNPFIPGQPSVNTFINRALAGNVTIGGDLFVNGVLSGGGFLNSLETNGYQKLPGGMIMQWGQTPAEVSAGVFTYNFPIPFPNACLNIISQTAVAITSDTDNQSNGTEIVNKTQFSITVDNNRSCFWFAIGY